jgi:hypothetical protein
MNWLAYSTGWALSQRVWLLSRRLCLFVVKSGADHPLDSAVIVLSHILIRNEDVGNERKTPTRNVNLWGVAKEINGCPSLHLSLSDQSGWETPKQWR